MRRARMTDYGRITVEDAPTPRPGSGDVLVAVDVCGICGSDIHAFAGLHPFIRPPVVPGHELGGTIAEIGEGVAGIRPGDRVTVEPSLVCGTCRNCRAGRYNICDHLKVIGCQADGGMAEYLRVPADRIVALPDAMSLDEGAFVEPTAVAVHAVERAGDVRDAGVVAVLGAGTIGLLVTQVARAAGARDIVVTDTVDARLAVAARLGATRIVNVRTHEMSARLREEYGDDHPVDLCFDCVGLEPSLDGAIHTARKGGRVVVVGVYPGRIPAEMDWVQDRELELVGSLMYTRRDFLAAIELIRTRRIQTDPLIARKVPLEQVADAYASFGAGPGVGIKTLVDVAAATGRQ